MVFAACVVYSIQASPVSLLNLIKTIQVGGFWVARLLSGGAEIITGPVADRTKPPTQKCTRTFYVE